MAKLCVVSENKAKFKVFKVDRDYKADLLVFVVDRDYKAKGDALWYMQDKESGATSTIAWVSSENKADIKVFFVDRDYKAKWNKPHKYQNML
ncbi:hypothetical protein HMPREF9309_00568 [Campylobacter ureolyticus ACS-301-V-Sch3b]|uniref:7(1) septoil knot domain-containing protein n=1 Tax=Campylobacter ureolyticus ACS-301-V-Sch3b TaxID=883165 RepID=S3XE20_9BACT|nr:DUF6150 family protein [Campylobacter ureolyticus]EPH09049.1 hypothetical protein HMPREF9309_00568 [Campylobacter ureolyticus ACS-301-V-Sch3b]